MLGLTMEKLGHVIVREYMEVKSFLVMYVCDVWCIQ